MFRLERSHLVHGLVEALEEGEARGRGRKGLEGPYRRSRFLGRGPALPREDRPSLGIETGDAGRQFYVVFARSEDRDAVTLSRRGREAALPRRRGIACLSLRGVEVASLCVIPALPLEDARFRMMISLSVACLIPVSLLSSGVVLPLSFRGTSAFGRGSLRRRGNVGAHWACSGRPLALSGSLGRAFSALMTFPASPPSGLIRLGIVVRGGRRRCGRDLVARALRALFARKKFLAAIVVVAPSPALLPGLWGVFAWLALIARSRLWRAALGKGEASAFIRGLFGPRSVGLLAGPGVTWFHGAPTLA